MNTITRVAKDARFFSNLSNARRALKKVLDVDTATANSFIHQEALEEGGRFWYSESAAQHAADALVNTDKATIVEVTTQLQPVAPSVTAQFELVGPVQPVNNNRLASTKSRSEVRNGVRRPIKGKCADVWAALDAEVDGGYMPSIKTVRELAEKHSWNLNNCTIEFYAWRKFNGFNNKAAN